MFVKLAVKSLIDRKGSITLSLLAMTVSIFVLLSVEHIRFQIKESFSSTLSGVDLVVGAKTGNLNLLLYSVFRIGKPTNNISWKSFKNFSDNPKVNWAIPLALGDSHKGYPVLGTNIDFFKYYSYGQNNKLVFDKGGVFDGLFDVVLGSEVARRLGLQLSEKLVISHGLSEISFIKHDEMPFTIVGVLKPTGTPVDNTLHVSLQAIEAIHSGYDFKQKDLKNHTLNKTLEVKMFAPQNITAFMVSLQSKITTFQFQREINNYSKEPLLAILPGVVLSELWQIMGFVENSLLLISALVFLSACSGVSAILLSSIRERIKDIHLLRVMGAPPIFIFFLLELEALIITFVSVIFAIIMLFIFSHISQSYLVAKLGLNIEKAGFSELSLLTLVIIISTSLIVSLIPALYAYFKGTRKEKVFFID